VFPTLVGLNRNILTNITQRHCVPHTRGAEPVGFA